MTQLDDDFRRYMAEPRGREAVERVRAEERLMRYGRCLLPFVRLARALRHLVARA